MVSKRVRKSEKKPIRKLDMMRGYARSIMLILALAISALWLSESHWFLSPIVVKSIKSGLRNVLGVVLFWFAITFLIGGSMRCYLCCHVALTNENYSLGDLWRAFSETCDEDDSDDTAFEMIDTQSKPRSRVAVAVVVAAEAKTSTPTPTAFLRRTPPLDHALVLAAPSS